MQNPYSMEDRRIIVTGAAQGIGRAVTQLAVQMGGRKHAAHVHSKTLNRLDTFNERPYHVINPN